MEYLKAPKENSLSMNGAEAPRTAVQAIMAKAKTLIGVFAALTEPHGEFILSPFPLGEFGRPQ